MYPLIKTPFLDIDLVNIYPAIAQDYYFLNEFVLKKENVSKGNYNVCYKIYYDQKEFGKLFTDFTFKNADINYVGLYLNNFTLYRPDTKQLIELFLSTFDLKVRNIKAVDIYLDSKQNIRNLFKKYFYNPVQYHFLNNGNIPFTENSDCKKVITLNRNRKLETASATYYVGNLKKTGKQVCIYNKTKEIELHSHKEYITQFHALNLDVGSAKQSDVYRYELRLTNTWLSTKFAIDWKDLFNNDYLMTILKETQLDFRKNTNDRVSRCVKIDLFDFAKANLQPIKWFSTYLNKDTQKTIVSNEKLLIRLIEQAFTTNDKKLLADIKQLSITLNLHAFFLDKTKDYPKQKTEITKDIFDSLF